jgi:hypothetical protein
MRTLLATLCFLTMADVQAKAEVTVKEYKARMASSDAALVFATKYYVRGLGEGMVWANTSARLRQAPLFCSPHNLELTVENFIDIIDRQILMAQAEGEGAYVEGTYIGLLLSAGLEETFPCERNWIESKPQSRMH